MRIVRRASLVFSLTLIVAIAVGYIVRQAEMADERDLRLTAAAELGAANLTAIIESLEVAGSAGTDPAQVVDAVTSTYPELGVCAFDADDLACGSLTDEPSNDLVNDRQDARAAAHPDDLLTAPAVSVYESMLTVAVDGPDLSIVAQGPASLVGGRTDPAVWVTTLLPAGARGGGFVVEGGVRQTAANVAAADGVYVVAAGEQRVELPIEEQRFYGVIFTLAVVLLLLAGVTLFVEQRNLVERASFDPLTKLPNRSEFERRAAEALAAAERQDGGLCLLLFDLNGFKQVNDTFGHHAGDELLKVVGQRLRKAVREGDVVARWGGDEFVVVLPGIRTEEMGTRRAAELADQVGGRVRLDGVSEPLRTRVSVGVALWPDHGESLDDLVLAADQAMYQAKREGTTSRVAEPVPRPEPVRLPV